MKTRDLVSSACKSQQTPATALARSSWAQGADPMACAATERYYTRGCGEFGDDGRLRRGTRTLKQPFLRITVLDAGCVTAVLRAFFATMIERHANMPGSKGFLALLKEALLLRTRKRTRQRFASAHVFSRSYRHCSRSQHDGQTPAHNHKSQSHLILPCSIPCMGLILIRWSLPLHCLTRQDHSPPGFGTILLYEPPV